jgi:uncharacterized protein (TIGR03083 family)
VDAAQRELSGQVDGATQRLLDDARTLSEADLRAASLLPGWTRAHVLAHVARDADAMRNLLIGARSGQARPRVRQRPGQGRRHRARRRHRGG